MALSDVQLGSLNNGELLTYNNTANKWVNQVKPDYTIEEMKDFDNTVAKLDNDFMSYNLSKDKWEPKTFELEVENYLSLRALNNTLISPVTNTLIRMPVFNNINISQTYFGDFVAITSDYSL